MNEEKSQVEIMEDNEFTVEDAHDMDTTSDEYTDASSDDQKDEEYSTPPKDKTEKMDKELEVTPLQITPDFFRYRRAPHTAPVMKTKYIDDLVEEELKNIRSPRKLKFKSKLKRKINIQKFNEYTSNPYIDTEFIRNEIYKQRHAKIRAFKSAAELRRRVHKLLSNTNNFKTVSTDFERRKLDLEKLKILDAIDRTEEAIDIVTSIDPTSPGKKISSRYSMTLLPKPNKKKYAYVKPRVLDYEIPKVTPRKIIEQQKWEQEAKIMVNYDKQLERKRPKVKGQYYKSNDPLLERLLNIKPKVISYKENGVHQRLTREEREKRRQERTPRTPKTPKSPTATKTPTTKSPTTKSPTTKKSPKATMSLKVTTMSPTTKSPKTKSPTTTKSPTKSPETPKTPKENSA